MDTCGWIILRLGFTAFRPAPTRLARGWPRRAWLRRSEALCSVLASAPQKQAAACRRLLRLRRDRWLHWVFGLAQVHSADGSQKISRWEKMEPTYTCFLLDVETMVEAISFVGICVGESNFETIHSTSTSFSCPLGTQAKLKQS